MDKGDPCKFSISTPKVGTSSYTRIFDPSSKRIVQGTKGVLESIKRIIYAKGDKIPDYNNRTGRRRESNGKKSSNFGGARKRKLAEDDYGECLVMHNDAKRCSELKLEHSKSTFMK